MWLLLASLALGGLIHLGLTLFNDWINKILRKMGFKVTDNSDDA